ncbi:hypothetical protein [Stappia sp. MMSF_3263]|uniref:hypothetical protein n=1 Tax=Stappia sp. MMSF_3263 TaxID=3046693 RepID=UPI00273F00BF|nr:hypothetical protein [Stappia sp. MMSF_3263]
MPYALLLVRLFAAYALVVFLPSLPHALSLSYGAGTGLAGAISSTLLVAAFLFCLLLVLVPRIFVAGLGFETADAKAAPISERVETVGVSLLGLFVFLVGMKAIVLWTVAWLTFTFGDMRHLAANDWVLEQLPGLVASLIVVLVGILLMVGPGKVAGMLRAIRRWRPGEETA